jgi:hypothetical protein
MAEPRNAGVGVVDGRHDAANARRNVLSTQASRRGSYGASTARASHTGSRLWRGARRLPPPRPPHGVARPAGVTPCATTRGPSRSFRTRTAPTDGFGHVAPRLRLPERQGGAHEALILAIAAAARRRSRLRHASVLARLLGGRGGAGLTASVPSKASKSFASRNSCRRRRSAHRRRRRGPSGPP